MKKFIIIIFLCNFLILNAQENAINFIIPKVKSKTILYSCGEKNITGDIASVNKNIYSYSEIDYVPRIENDGSSTYKIVFYINNVFSQIEDHAYFVNFSGNKANFKGYSKYLINDENIFKEIENESYKSVDIQSYYQVPSESYQTTEWTYTDPNNQKIMNAKGYYKTMFVNGKEEKIFIVEHTSKNTYSDKDVRTEYFMKNFGLIAIQANKNENFYVVDMGPFKLYSKSYIDNLNEADARNKGWDMIEGIENILHENDSLTKEVEDRASRSMDSLVGLYQHMMIKYPEKENLYRYILSLIYDYWADEYYYNAQKTKNFKSFTAHINIMEYLNDYYLMRLSPGYIPKGSLTGFVTMVEEDYYKTYWSNMYNLFKTIADYGVQKTYYVYLLKNEVELIENNESTINGKYQFLLHSYLAIYYNYKKDPIKTYYNFVLTLENYKALTSEEKDLNIEYMKSLMKKMTEEKPSNETDLIRGIKAALNLNDNVNALKIADNGYGNGVGLSLDFSMLFAKIAYDNNLDKNYLRKAMQLMQNKIPAMSSSQIKEYLVYCRAMNPEFDCSKAESEVKKIEKREKAEQEKKLKESKKASKKNNNYSSERKVNFALATNPFAGFNVSGKGGFFKFLPVSAELRTGGIIHEFRINTFMGNNFKNRFIGGKMVENAPTQNSGWINLKGADYSYGLYFVKNKISSYKKECESAGGGIQFLYGNFTTDPEMVLVKQKNANTLVKMNPQISRYEVLLNYKGAVFSWKSHIFITGFWGIGAGSRSIKYNPSTAGFTEEMLKDETKTIFEDKRYNQKNWTGYYLAFRLGFRFGINLF